MDERGSGDKFGGRRDVLRREHNKVKTRRRGVPCASTERAGVIMESVTVGGMYICLERRTRSRPGIKH